jgi:hypothetical protein
MIKREKDILKWFFDNEYWLQYCDIRASVDWVGLPLKDFLDKITDVKYNGTELELLMYLLAKTNRFDNEKIKSTLDYIEYYRKNLLSEISRSRGNVCILDINAVTKFLKEQLNDNEVTLSLPDNLLQALQQAGFIENAAAKPWKWTANKQLLRELLTYSKIKGTLSVAEIERQTPKLFVDKKATPLNYPTTSTLKVQKAKHCREF